MRAPEMDHVATVPVLLRRAAERFGDDDYVVSATDRLSFRAADDRSAAVARALLAAGAGKGTRIGIVLPSSIEFAVAFLAAARIGAVAMLFSSTYKPAELARVLRISDTDTLVAPQALLGRPYEPLLEATLPGLADHGPGPLRLTAAPYLRRICVVPSATRPWGESLDPGDVAAAGAGDVTAELLAAVESEVAPADLLLGIFTSGSSADPKAVLHTHGAALGKTHPTSGMGLQTSQPGVRLFNAMPFFWVGGPQILLGSLHTGSSIICQERFDPDEALHLIEREHPNAVGGWPTLLDGLREHAIASGRAVPPFLQPGAAGASTLPRSSRGHAINMGMTETFGPHRNRDYFDYRVVDPATGGALPDGEEGEFCVRGFGLMAGLYKKEREETFDADGYYHTGDRGYIEDGQIFFTGRLSEMIKSGGANVSPLEVEQTLLSLPGVAEAYVVGVPNPARGEEVVSFVVPADGATLDPDEVRAELKSLLSAYKVPSRVLVVDEVPTLATGKVDKRTLRTLVAEGA